MDYSKMSIEDLILNEDNINWEEFSSIRKTLSLAEIRLFRSKIKWHLFFLKGGALDYDQMTIASKYFNNIVYSILSVAHWLPKQFLIEHKEQFRWKSLIHNVYLDPNTILNCLDVISSEISNHTELVYTFENALFFDIHEPEYEEVLLYLSVK